MWTPARAERDRAPPAVLAAGPHPGELAERDPTVAEQPQRAQQVFQQLAPARDRRGFAVIARGGRAVVVHAEAERKLLRNALALLELQRHEKMLRAAIVADARGLRGVARSVGRGDRQALGQRDLLRGDRHPVERRDHRQRVARARHLGAREPLDRRAHALAGQLEVAAPVEHVDQQHAQRCARTRLPERARARAAARAHVARDYSLRAPAAACQVAVEPVHLLERAHRGGVLGKQRQLAVALGDERLGQRLVAVERRLAAVPPAAGGQLEGDLGAAREIAPQHPGRHLDEVGERSLKLAGEAAAAHVASVRARDVRSCSAQARLQRAPLDRRDRHVGEGLDD